MQIPVGRGEKPYGDPSRGYLTCQSVGESLLYLGVE
jgi:hypothetical protein